MEPVIALNWFEVAGLTVALGLLLAAVFAIGEHVGFMTSCERGE